MEENKENNTALFETTDAEEAICNRRSPTATGAEVNGRRAVRQRPA